MPLLPSERSAVQGPAPIPRQRWMRIIPVALVMYTISYIDRTNVSLALPFISRDLYMDPAQAGNAVGIFFWGYIALQVPGGHLAARWSAKRLVSLLLVSWGTCAMWGGLVHSWHGFWLTRLALGITEGGVFPATLVLLAKWFPKRERGRANAYWMLCQPLALIISSPVSGYILDRWNWRVLLVSEGCLPFVWLIVWELAISEQPSEAPWISAAEREYIESSLQRERDEITHQERVRDLRTLLQPTVLLLMAVYFLLNVGSYGYLFWLPSALASVRKLSGVATGLLFTIPYFLSGISMVLNARASDRSGDRRRFVTWPLIAAGALLIIGVLTSGSAPLPSFAMICLAGAGPYATLGPFWAIPTELLPRETAGATMGLINAHGALGGFFGPYVVGHMSKHTGNFTAAFVLLGAALVASGIVAGCLGHCGKATHKFADR